MAAMVRNAAVLLVRLGVVVQLCSVVPPAAAAGRRVLQFLPPPLSTLASPLPPLAPLPLPVLAPPPQRR